MKIKLLLVSFLLINVIACNLYAQQPEKPKLVVGIVVDQMRFDYLYRFKEYYGSGGFNRLMNEGSNFVFAHYNYIPTSTALGHSTVYTGTTPFYHGIIGNDWYDKEAHKMIYCIRDTTEKTVGSDDDEGEMSPRHLMTTTITDQLKLFTVGKSKVISISLKERAAVLPGGHMADGAYWYDGNTGSFISSTYYMKSLPEWAVEFNNKKLADKYLSQSWSLFKPTNDYSGLGSDESNYEKDLFNEGKTSFPHKFDKVAAKDKYWALENTPYGNQVVEEFVKTALINENLGKGTVTDFLAVSFSSTDHVGHEYGTYSYELEDTYLRLDAQVADLLNALDKQVGKGNYLLFITADHAGMEPPAYSREHNLPTGFLGGKKCLDSLRVFAKRTFGDANLIENYSNRQIFLNRDVIRERNINIHETERKIKDYLRDTFDAISSIFTRDELEQQIAKRDSQNPILNGFNPARSGDIAFMLQPGFLPSYMEKGTTHGSSYSYDTHVPLIFYGWHVPRQTVNTPVYTVDIAPTISDLLKITEPSACIGIPLIK